MGSGANAKEDHALADRRPVAARGSGAIRSLALTLARSGVSANAVSIGSMAFAAIAGGAAMTTRWIEIGSLLERALWIAFVAGALLRGLANVIDGLVAVEGGRRSPTGPFWNEAPDRVADASLLIGFGFATSGEPTLGFAATAIAIMMPYVRELGRRAGTRMCFAGPMSKTQRLYTLVAAAAYLAAAPIAWRPSFPNGWGLPALTLIVIALLGAIGILRRSSIILGDLRRNASDTP